MEENNKAIPEFIVQLSNGLSNQIKTTNRFWLALALVSIITISTGSISFKNKQVDCNVGTKQSLKNIDEVKIPFIGEIRKDQFFPITASFISILIISFGILHSQTIRSKKLIDIALKDESKDQFIKLPQKIDIRDALDVITASSINKTAPLSQSLLGKFQFHHQAQLQSNICRRLLLIYNFMLKLIVSLLIYILPLYALWTAYDNGCLFHFSVEVLNIPVIALWVISFFSVIIMAQLLCFEISFIFSNLLRNWKIKKF